MTSLNNIRSQAELCDYLKHGGHAKFLLFWGHRPSKDRAISKTCFSQWFEAAFDVGAIRYPTAEHFMMAEKARLFNDNDALQRILLAPNPGAVKAIGREIRGFDDDKWVEHRWSIVVNANFFKFSQNESLRMFLLNTGDRVLVEASPVDCIWGIGLAADDPAAENPTAWKGLNLLGFALMQVRDQLRLQTS
jgi:ribA/ribD-fused uncharacterized protein